MANNFERHSEYVETALTVPAYSGEPVQLPSGVVGIAADNYPIGEVGRFFVTGVWRLRKAPGATAEAGASVFWDSTNRQAVFSGGTFQCGIASKPGVAGSSVVRVDVSRAGGTDMTAVNAAIDTKAAAATALGLRTDADARSGLSALMFGGGAPALSNWFKGGVSGKKIAWVGDSTTWLLETVPENLAYLTNNYTQAGQPLAGVTHMWFGASGEHMSRFKNNLTSPSTVAIAQVIAANPDLIVFCYGINDIRDGGTTYEMARATLLIVIQQLRAALPNCDILLRMPNSFVTTNIDGLNFVPSTHGFTGMTQAQAAQAAVNILRDTYRAAQNLWPNVVLLNTIGDVFPEICPATSPLLRDQIHPSNCVAGATPATNQSGFGKIIDAVVGIIGYKGVQPALGTKSIYAETIERTAGNGLITGAGNVRVGFKALGGSLGVRQTVTGVGNAVLGDYAAQAITNGGNNAIVGFEAGTALTIGSKNCLFGMRAGAALEVGNFNVLIGSEVSGKLVNGDFNVSLGQYSMFNAITSSRTIAIGAYSAFYETADYGFYANSIFRGSQANEQVQSLMYGRQNADEKLQFLRINAMLSPLQCAGQPFAWATQWKGFMFFDTTANKLKIGGASAWETVTSA